MIATIQIRRDTSANWIAVNPVLSSGEFGLDTWTGDVRIGDGSRTWSMLPTFVTLANSETADIPRIQLSLILLENRLTFIEGALGISGEETSKWPSS